MYATVFDDHEMDQYLPSSNHRVEHYSSVFDRTTKPVRSKHNAPALSAIKSVKSLGTRQDVVINPTSQSKKPMQSIQPPRENFADLPATLPSATTTTTTPGG